MTSAEVWRLIVQLVIALSSGVLLATLTRGWARRDKGVQDEVALKAEQMRSESGYRDELREENTELRRELKQARRECLEEQSQKDIELDALRRLIRVWEQHAVRQNWTLPEDPHDKHGAA